MFSYFIVMIFLAPSGATCL